LNVDACLKDVSDAENQGTHKQMLSSISLINSFRDVILTLTDKALFRALLLNRVQDSSSSALSVRSQLEVINLYADIMLSSRCSLETAGSHKQTTLTWEPVSVSLNLLNAAAFTRLEDKVTTCLWRMLERIGLDYVSVALQCADTNHLSTQTVGPSAGAQGNSFSAVSSSSMLMSFSGAPKSSSTSVGSFYVSTRSDDFRILEPLARASGLTVVEYCRSISNAFFLFDVCFNHQLSATDDDEFFSEYQVMNLSAILALIGLLRNWLRRLYITHPVISTSFVAGTVSNTPLPSTEQVRSKLHRAQQLHICTKLFNSLFARYERREFASELSWQWNVARLLPDDVETRDESQLPDMEEISTLYAEYQLALECVPQVTLSRRILHIMTWCDVRRRSPFNKD
jgi:hypothetical protein